MPGPRGTPVTPTYKATWTTCRWRPTARTQRSWPPAEEVAFWQGRINDCWGHLGETILPHGLNQGDLESQPL